MPTTIPSPADSKSGRLRFFIYKPDRDYYLGPHHAGWQLPTSTLITTDVDTADYILLPEDLRRLQVNLGINAVKKFIETLPHYPQHPDKHIFWSSHDDPSTPLEEGIFCKASVSTRQPGHFVAVPYIIEDLLHASHFDLSLIHWHTSFVGYPGSSPCREHLLKTMAADRSLSSHLDIAPKFHSHLDHVTRDARRQMYLATLAASLTVLCPRGDGMNSIRFFETLSMGRIPVLIADDCVLPFEQQIPYERFVIRIAEDEISQTPELINKWVRSKSAEELARRCREARTCWKLMLAPNRLAASLEEHLRLTRPSTRKQPTADLARARALQAYQAGNIQETLLLLNKALLSHPQDSETIRCLALVFNETGQPSASIKLLSSSSVPFASKERLLGEAYQQAGQWDQAYRLLLKASLAEPANPMLLMNLGIVCSRLNRPDEALAFLEQAARLEPTSAQLHMNRGCVLQSLQRMAEASAALHQAVLLAPDYGTARWNLAQLLLLQGKLEQGFELFESRFTKNDPVPIIELPIPRWCGEQIAGRTIIISTEQAYGDAIQFVRYLPLLAQQGARVILYNHLKPLQKLFKSLPGVAAVIEDLELLPIADYHLPLLSLPRLFTTTLQTIPNRMIPYLAPGSQKLDLWKNKLADVTGLKIGLCWAGRSEPDPRRSALLSDFDPLAQLDNAVFYSLQVGVGPKQAATPPQGLYLLNLTEEIEDFEDTAALIIQLDLVISVDTSVAHLAGALGKPTFTLLPYAPDWRWLLERDDSPWYPSMQLFRQERPGDWSAPIKKIVSVLSKKFS